MNGHNEQWSKERQAAEAERLNAILNDPRSGVAHRAHCLKIEAKYLTRRAAEMVRRFWNGGGPTDALDVAPDKEAGNTMSEHNEQNERIDPRQAAEIARLKALTKVDGPGKTREERAIEVLRTMLFTLDLGMNDMMADAECPETLGRLVRQAANILNVVCGRIFAPPEENLADLIKDCQDTLAAMKKARQEEHEARRAQVHQRYSRMAEGMSASPSGGMSANPSDKPGPAPTN